MRSSGCTVARAPSGPTSATSTGVQRAEPGSRCSRTIVACGTGSPVSVCSRPVIVTSSPSRTSSARAAMVTIVRSPSMSYVVTAPGEPTRIASMLNGAPSQPNPIV